MTPSYYTFILPPSLKPLVKKAYLFNLTSKYIYLKKDPGNNLCSDSGNNTPIMDDSKGTWNNFLVFLFLEV